MRPSFVKRSNVTLYELPSLDWILSYYSTSPVRQHLPDQFVREEHDAGHDRVGGPRANAGPRAATNHEAPQSEHFLTIDPGRTIL